MRKFMVSNLSESAESKLYIHQRGDIVYNPLSGVYNLCYVTGKKNYKKGLIQLMILMCYSGDYVKEEFYDNPDNYISLRDYFNEVEELLAAPKKESVKDYKKRIDSLLTSNKIKKLKKL